MQYARILVLLLATGAPIGTAPTAPETPTWPRYLPEKVRRKIFDKARTYSRASPEVTAYWITDKVAQAFVSSALERGRLADAEADRAYELLWRRDRYLFAIPLWGERVAADNRMPRRHLTVTDLRILVGRSERAARVVAGKGHGGSHSEPFGESQQ
jgi:hypothetical protein